MAIGIILAAHPDDEVIGCYSLLRDKQVQAVIYLQQEDFPAKRYFEAAEAAAHFNYCHHFIEVPDVCYEAATNRPQFEGILQSIYNEIRVVAAAIYTPSTLTDIEENAVPDDTVTIYAHSSTDSHAHHNLVNMFAKALPSYIKSVDKDLSNRLNPVKYYSVDMVKAEPLGEAASKDKLRLLLKLFPSQRELFKADAKYSLFESFIREETTSVTVSFSYEGIHCYPNAPDAVAFLRNPHRHVFHVDASIEVFHDDRDVEFILLKRELQKLVSSKMDNKSCEMAAREIVDYLYFYYPARKCKVTVSEDRENSATVNSGL